jgi:elongation factor 1-gamma
VRFFETVVNQPSIKEVFGSTSYAEKPLQYVPPAKEKKPEAPKSEAPKAEKKPKPVEEDDDDDDKAIEEPKAKNPLDSLPKSTFNLEDWKRAYSNKETRGANGALEWFYEKYLAHVNLIADRSLTMLSASTRKDTLFGVSTSNTQRS